MLDIITSIINTTNVSPPTSIHPLVQEDFKASLHTQLTKVGKVNSSSNLKGYNKEADDPPKETLTTKVSINQAGEKFLVMLANTSVVRQIALTEDTPPKPSINYAGAKKAYDFD